MSWVLILFRSSHEVINFLAIHPIFSPSLDPALLEGGVDAPLVDWGYPPGAPTPDPALLTGAVEEPVVTWG